MDVRSPWPRLTDFGNGAGTLELKLWLVQLCPCDCELARERLGRSNDVVNTSATLGVPARPLFFLNEFGAVCAGGILGLGGGGPT